MDHTTLFYVGTIPGDRGKSEGATLGPEDAKAIVEREVSLSVGSEDSIGSFVLVDIL